MEEGYTQSYVKIEKCNNEVSAKNIKECLQEHAERQPEKEALIFVSTDGDRQSVTWTQLYEKSCATARSMIKLGVRRKEIVAVNLRTCPEWLFATFGAMIAGAIPVSISFTYTDGSDLVAMMEKLQCCALLVMDPGLDKVNWNIVQGLMDDINADGRVRSTKLTYLRYLIGVGIDSCSATVKCFHSFLKDNNADVNLPEIEPDDIALMFQTSGSTGVPKLVSHTNASLLSMASSDLAFVDANYSVFNDRPFNWLGGFPKSILTGQKRVTISGFCPAPKNRSAFIRKVIMQEKCSIMLAMPPVLNELIKGQDELLPEWPLLGVMTGGQPLTKALASCVGKVGKFLCCIYGMTESLFLTQATVTDSNNFTEYGCGTPLKIRGLEMKVVDENEQIVPVNTRGEIYVRSPGMFKEYLNDPEKTSAVKTSDGWYKTDYIGRMTEKGEFLVEGRKSNMIISGGMTVAPEILEQVMKTAPGVESVVIVPVPDDVYFQVICACVIRKTGCDVTEVQLREYCTSFHADKPGLFTVLPKYYLFLEKFPETNTGKINKKEIEKLAQARFITI